MSKKTKVLKYKVVNTNIDKKFIGKNLDLERVKSKTGLGGDDGRKPGSKNKITLAKLSDKVDNLTDNLNKLAKIVTDGFAEQVKFNKSIREDLNRVIKLNNLKH
jgi:hypothetical protein